MNKNIFTLKNKAKLQYDTAFHLLNVTYPLINDPKLLLGVVNNIFLSIEASIEIILEYEKQLLLISPYSKEFQNKFNIFRSKSAKRHEINKQDIINIEEIHTILTLHKKSPVEFRRKDRFIICNKDYKMYEITTKEIKNYLKTNIHLLESINKINL
jgi:hypothetical protein